jgi:hypothetical protein
MARHIAFSPSEVLGAAPKTERRASLVERGTNWLPCLRTARNGSRIERYIHEHGGILTDRLEREITQKFTNRSGSLLNAGKLGKPSGDAEQFSPAGLPLARTPC